MTQKWQKGPVILFGTKIVAWVGSVLPNCCIELGKGNQGCDRSEELC